LQDLPKPDDKIQIEYDITDAAFISLVQAIALGTYTIFTYDPTEDESKQLYARIQGKPVAAYENVTLDPSVIREMRARLIVAEKKLLYIHRHCKGDASETGLVQFAQAIMDLDDIRGKYKTHEYKNDAGKPIECLIPFSSDIKFNAFIRDMGEEGHWIYMKGAPERILTRCSRILVDGEEVEFSQEIREECNQANSDFGKLGERVLAFARYRLPTDKFNASYQYDVRNWKSWGLDPKRSYADYSEEPGTFPMHDLCLVGVVSLNDPPRPKVDLSVNKCRAAGIKVIMVTGDQPPTAAAIANKVNILKNPKKEFGYLCNTMKMDKEKAWEAATGVVIHGDLLAEKHLEDQKLDDLDPNKGKYMQDWISKPEVVFARTTPSQKLLIVNACQ